jgi:formate hydrogenlyase transcriptional activator
MRAPGARKSSAHSHKTRSDFHNAARKRFELFKQKIASILFRTSDALHLGKSHTTCVLPLSSDLLIHANFFGARAEMSAIADNSAMLFDGVSRMDKVITVYATGSSSARCHPSSSRCTLVRRGYERPEPRSSASPDAGARRQITQCRGIEGIVAEAESRRGAQSDGGALEGAGARETALKDANEVKEREGSLRRVVDAIPALAWCARPDGSIEFLNKQWHDYTGLSADEASGWGYQAAFHPDDRANGMERCRKLLSGDGPAEGEIRLRRHDGVYRRFLTRVEPFRDETGQIVRWYGTSTDIETLKQTEEKLREDERELRRITDAIPQTIVVLDPGGVPMYANQATLDYTGIDPEDVLAPDFRKRIFHPDDLERLREERRVSLERGLPFEAEQRALRKDGQYRWFLIRYNPFRDGQGDIVRWYATGTDIDERKRNEERTRNENIVLREEFDHSLMFEEIVGSSNSLGKVLKAVGKVATTDSTVLILGETGTGKELIARAIHKRSPRSSRAFISINCAAIPPALIAAELFGHEKGAFTGALERRIGRFEAADGGTLFLDEVGDLPAETQITLLRVLQEHEFERIGSTKPVQVDVRVLAATNRDLALDVEEGFFRPDLYYRLNVFPVNVPPLRQRIEDIPLLAQYLVGRYAKKAGKKITAIDRPTLQMLQNYDWPGNVRELQNVIERAVILCETPVLYVDETWFRRDVPSRTGQHVSINAALTTSEREMIERALSECSGRVGGPNGAAAKLGLPRQTLESKIKNLGINKFRFRRA